MAKTTSRRIKNYYFSFVYNGKKILHYNINPTMGYILLMKGDKVKLKGVVYTIIDKMTEYKDNNDVIVWVKLEKG